MIGSRNSFTSPVPPITPSPAIGYLGRPGLVLALLDEIAQFLRGDVRPLVAVLEGINLHVTAVLWPCHADLVIARIPDRIT